MIKFEDFNFDNISLDQKSYKYILDYNILYKTSIGAKPLRIIRFDKIDGFMRVYNGTRYLVLLGDEKYNSICNIIRHLVSLESGIIYAISHNYVRIKVDSYNSF